MEQCLEAVVDISALLICLAAIVVFPPPFVCLVVLALVVTLLIPRLRAEQDVSVLDFLVSPDSVVHTLPAQGLESVVDVGESNPSAREEVAEHGLIRELVICGD
jgi:hypothetical protein